ncbi:class I SAM-dependent methyltransferase [Nonomuraea zeae]|uniref:Class I SAM-dependent methyltransferase n=1 Tax=Nonomuraea zeae TaxID=1642303 RepID=A0A5S4FQG2_9ACTN|nr:class I SAM-dependent methyltransferase [Nonomuraea zeae]TMR22932.1 class I SAM-dependent methyltransferase [Nonomuraea zeae]
MHEDNYAVAVPFYDLWHEDGHVPAVREQLPALLRGVRRAVIEIGAGTGLITEVIARRTPAEIFAVEPSLGMRSVLVSRLASDPEVLRRVTVLPCGALDVAVGEPVEAIVMISVLQSFSAGERARLWRVLAGQLEPGGRLVFNWRERAAAVPGELAVMASYRVGRHDYEIAGQVIEVAGESVTSRFRYRIKQGGEVISEDEVVGTNHWPAGELVASELERAGFARGEGSDGLQVWHLAK